MNSLKLHGHRDHDCGCGHENLVQRGAGEHPAELVNHHDVGLAIFAGEVVNTRGGWVTSAVTVAMTITMAVV